MNVKSFSRVTFDPLYNFWFYVKFGVLLIGSVYYIVKTALSAETKRKHWMAKKLCWTSLPTERPKKTYFVRNSFSSTSNSKTIIKELFHPSIIREGSRTHFFFQSFGNAVNFWPKRASKGQFLLRNSHAPFNLE